MKWLLLTATILIALLLGGVNLLPVQTDHSPRSPDTITRPATDDTTVRLPSPPEFPRLPDHVGFAAEVVPILQRRCVGCHPGPAVDESTHSHFAQLATQLSEADSPCHCLHTAVDCEGEGSEVCRETLTPAEVQLLARWADEGACCPTPQPDDFNDWSAAEREHWAWQPLRSPEIPGLDVAGGGRNPIDAFVVSRLAQEGHSPAPPADAATLVRRLSLAVTGLAPSPQDLERLAAAGPNEFDLYVDELLASPAYGEHWARYWLDLVRYADTNGYEDDGPKPLAWKYRDFVIRSLNEDRPYDAFVRMQLAGDLSPHPTADDYIAVGFLRLGAWNSEPDDALVDRYDQLDDIVSTTGQVFLGMTIGCARCHDHPDEPMTALDYARVVGCFHGLGRPVQGRLEEASESATRQQLTDAAMKRERQQQLRGRAFSADATQAAALRREAASIEDDVRFDHAYRLVETDVSHEPTRRLLRGDPHHPAEFVKAGVPSVLADGPFCDDVLPRRQLAEWVITQGRGLSARVMVNRVWAWHFGRGLVDTPGNLGLSGSRPTHPELLEWLANWFVNEANWSLKKLHRLILTSRTYLARVDLRDKTRQQLYGAFPRRRLRAEVLHDAMLSLAGLQDRDMFGPPVTVTPSDRSGRATEPTGTSAASTWHRRRAIYLPVVRNTPNPFLATFDASTTAVSCAQRQTTHTSQQALTLWNGPLAQACATAVADQIVGNASLSRSQQVDAAFVRIIGRVPDEFERETSLQFLDQQPDSDDSATIALGQLCLVLFNSDEFVFLD